jgi:flagellar biosynthesis activator protein FlaF
LTQAALKMKAARDANDREAMLFAVRINWRLWTIIQAELLDPQCTVPMDLRTNVLSLAQFVDKHSVETIGKPSPKRLDVLIAINRELAGGLFTTPQPDVHEAADASPSPNQEASEASPGGPARYRSRSRDAESAGEPLRIST